MVFEVIGSSAALTERTLTEPTLTEPTLAGPTRTAPDPTPSGRSVPDGAPSDLGTSDRGATVPDAAAAPAARRRRAVPPGVITQLLRSAVSLQAEGVLRTAGALAGAWGGVLDRTEWIERDARDLSVLAAAAVAAQVPLPAGVDTGAADPKHPGSVVESLLAGHEALVHVLRELADASGDDEDDAWCDAVRSILSRREEEILLLRAVGASGELPADERYLRGRPPRV